MPFSILRYESAGTEACGVQENVQADWAQKNPKAPDFIKNKPDIEGLEDSVKALTTRVQALVLRLQEVSSEVDQMEKRLQDEIKGVATRVDSAQEAITDLDNRVKALEAEPPGDSQTQADWNETDASKVAYIRNKPDFAGLEKRVGSNSDKLDSLGARVNNVERDTTGLNTQVAALDERVTSLEKNPGSQTQADWAEMDTTSAAYIRNKPDIADLKRRVDNNTGAVARLGDRLDNAESDIKRVENNLGDKADQTYVDNELDQKLSRTGGVISGSLTVNGLLTAGGVSVGDARIGNNGDLYGSVWAQFGNAKSASEALKWVQQQG